MTHRLRALITGLLLKTAETTLAKTTAPETGIKTESLIPPARPKSQTPSARFIPTARTITAAPWAILS